MNAQPANDIVREVPEPVTTKRRPLLFLATYLIGVIIAAGIFASQIAYPYEDWLNWLLTEVFLPTVFLLPWGSAVVVQWLLDSLGTNAELMRTTGPFPGPSSSLGVFIGLFDYLLCFVIPLAGSLTRKQRTFRILYFAFIGLLILNIGGCSLTA